MSFKTHELLIANHKSFSTSFSISYYKREKWDLEKETIDPTEAEGLRKLSIA